jgi:hypothetical protein
MEKGLSSSLRVLCREALVHDYFAEKPLAKPPNLMPTFPTQHDQVRHDFLRSSIT